MTGQQSIKRNQQKNLKKKKKESKLNPPEAWITSISTPKKWVLRAKLPVLDMIANMTNDPQAAAIKNTQSPQWEKKRRIFFGKKTGRGVKVETLFFAHFRLLKSAN